MVKKNPFSVEEFHLLMENCPYLITEVDIEGTILKTSRDLDVAGPIVGRKIFDFVADEHHAEIEASLKQAFLQKRSVKYHAKGNIDLGQREYVSQFIPVIENEKVLKVLQMTEDVTDQRWTERQLVESSKLAALGELASAVGHEINNPLAIVKGYLEIVASEIKKNGIENEKIKSGIDAQLLSIDRIAKISGSLRTFAKRHTDSGCFDLGEVIRSTVVLYELLFSHHSIFFDVHLTDEQCAVDGDPDCLYQVLSNLFNNARDAFSEQKNGVIGVKTTIHDDHVKVYIQDDGKGIPEQDLKKIFDAYYTSKEWGTGLGLNISHRLINSMDGQIHVESKEGEGSRFTIVLPLSSQPLPKSLPKATNEDRIYLPKLHGRALIIEDEIMLAAVIEDCLTEFGVDVTVCNEGECGLVALKKNQYKFVISDLTLPGLKGIPLLEELIPHLNEAKLIVITGGNLPDSPEYKRLLSQNKIAATVSKPFSRNQIVNAVNGVGQGLAN